MVQLIALGADTFSMPQRAVSLMSCMKRVWRPLRSGVCAFVLLNSLGHKSTTKKRCAGCARHGSAAPESEGSPGGVAPRRGARRDGGGGLGRVALHALAPRRAREPRIIPSRRSGRRAQVRFGRSRQGSVLTQPSGRPDSVTDVSNAAELSKTSLKSTLRFVKHACVAPGAGRSTRVHFQRLRAAVCCGSRLRSACGSAPE